MEFNVFNKKHHITDNKNVCSILGIIAYFYHQNSSFGRFFKDIHIAARRKHPILQNVLISFFNISFKKNYSSYPQKMLQLLPEAVSAYRKRCIGLLGADKHTSREGTKKRGAESLPLLQFAYLSKEIKHRLLRPLPRLRGSLWCRRWSPP